MASLGGAGPGKGECPRHIFRRCRRRCRRHCRLLYPLLFQP